MPWTDTERPSAERVEALLAEMTLDEKLAQLGSVWVGAELGSGNVAPMQEAFARAPRRSRRRARTGSDTSPARSAPSRSIPSTARAGSPTCSATSSSTPGSASRRSRTRSA